MRGSQFFLELNSASIVLFVSIKNACTTVFLVPRYAYRGT